MNEQLNIVASILGSAWFATAFSASVILAVTAVVARCTTVFLRRVLQRDGSPLPSSSIFINIPRATIWTLGACVMFATCFNVNVSAAIAALGVGGIAISLGFQDTISNLIGGLQVSLMKIVVPGDNITVNGETGVVTDVTWRHTTIITPLRETVVVPNSIIGKNSLTKMAPPSLVTVKFVAPPNVSDLDALSADLVAACTAGVEAEHVLTAPPKVLFSEVTGYGVSGKIVFEIEDGTQARAACDAAVRAIAPYVVR